MCGGSVQRVSQGSTQDLGWMFPDLSHLALPLFLTTSSLEHSHISIYGRVIPLGMSSFLMSGCWCPGGGCCADVCPVRPGFFREGLLSSPLENLADLTWQWKRYNNGQK